MTKLLTSVAVITVIAVLAGPASALEQMPQKYITCLLYTSPSPRDGLLSRMPSSA